MIKISDAIFDIVMGNNYLRFGVYKHILNLSQVAETIRPLVEARTCKEVKKSAILMNLSRFQRRVDKIAPPAEDVKLLNISVRSDLCSMTFYRTPQVFTKLQELYSDTCKKNGFITINQGTNEITLIVDASAVPAIREAIKSKPKYVRADLVALEMQFDEKYADIPGLIYHVIQCVTLQSINISEISSTYTSLIVFIDQKDMKIAFDTLFKSFVEKR